MSNSQVFTAAAKATATYTGQQGETITGTGTATATSAISYEDALNKAKKIAANIAHQNAQNNANVIDESVAISTSVGSNTEIIYNKDGVLAGSPKLTFDENQLLVKGSLQVGERNDGKDAYISGNVNAGGVNAAGANLIELNVTDDTRLKGKLIVGPQGTSEFADFNTTILGGAAIDKVLVLSNITLDDKVDKREKTNWVDNQFALQVVGDSSFVGDLGHAGDSYNFGTLNQKGKIEVTSGLIIGEASLSVAGGSKTDTLLVGPTGTTGFTGFNVNVDGGAVIDQLVVGLDPANIDKWALKDFDLFSRNVGVDTLGVWALQIALPTAVSLLRPIQNTQNMILVIPDPDIINKPASFANFICNFEYNQSYTLTQIAFGQLALDANPTNSVWTFTISNTNLIGSNNDLIISNTLTNAGTYFSPDGFSVLCGFSSPITVPPGYVAVLTMKNLQIYTLDVRNNVVQKNYYVVTVDIANRGS